MCRVTDWSNMTIHISYIYIYIHILLYSFLFLNRCHFFEALRGLWEAVNPRHLKMKLSLFVDKKFTPKIILFEENARV